MWGEAGQLAMPPKRKAAARVLREATDTEDEPKSKRARPAPKMGAKKKTRAYKMPPPLPAGQMLTDVTRKLSWSLGESVGKGGFGEIYRASPVGSSKRVQHVIKIVCMASQKGVFTFTTHTHTHTTHVFNGVRSHTRTVHSTQR